MMQYRTFKITDQEGVNGFLKENSEFLAPDSLIISDGNISFLFDPNPPLPEVVDKEIKPKATIYEAGLKKTLQTTLIESVEKEMSIRVYQREISQLEALAEKEGKSITTLERNKQYKNLVALLENTRTEMRIAETTIETCRDMLEQISNGEYKLPLGYKIEDKIS